MKVVGLALFCKLILIKKLPMCSSFSFQVSCQITFYIIGQCLGEGMAIVQGLTVRKVQRRLLWIEDDKMEVSSMTMI